MKAAPQWKTGDAVTICHGDRRIAGQIELASKNGVSLMVTFEAMIGGHAGMMPLLRGADGVYRSIIDETEVRLEPRYQPSR